MDASNRYCAGNTTIETPADLNQWTLIDVARSVLFMQFCGQFTSATGDDTTPETIMRLHLARAMRACPATFLDGISLALSVSYGPIKNEAALSNALGRIDNQLTLDDWRNGND